MYFVSQLWYASIGRLKLPMNQKDRTGELALSWGRRQWRKIVAIVEDHPKLSILAFILGGSLVLFYATRLQGLAHFRESLSRWKVETFGGVHQVDRAVRMADVILSFRPSDHDRLDVLSLTSIHFGGNAFREELKALAKRGGKMRIVLLDPRIGDRGSAMNDAFLKLAEAFGQKPWEFRARCWYAAAVVLRLSEELGDGLEFRMLSEPIRGAVPPFFSPGRSAHSYMASEPTDRMDIVIPRPDLPGGSDTSTHPAWVIVDRYEQNEEVSRFTEAFQNAWSDAAPVDEALAKQLREYLDGPEK